MRKVLFVALVAVFVMAMAGTAFAAVSLSSSGLNATAFETVQKSFTVTLKKAAADPEDVVRVKVTVSNKDGLVPADAALQYFETTDSTWRDLPLTVVDGNTLETWFGPASGFPMTATPYNAGATSQFRVTFADGTAGDYEFLLQVVKTSDSSVLASANGAMNVFNGAAASGSNWTYRDLADSAAKYEGGYAAFDNATTGQYTTSPHGGYDTSTNKCNVCHAVHRAEGAYYLLRADSQDDACDYCHIGSAHSSKVVYDLNSAGKDTSNGHTIGASTYIPDSTVAQWTEAVTLRTVNADGSPLSETIEVRAYDEQKNDMYRFARHHGHSEADGGSRRNLVPVGPLALRCMSCHQVHNATAQTWQVRSVVDAAGVQNNTPAGYKLLRQFPSGTFIGGKDANGQIPLTNISVVPESTLTAGVNFDAVRAQGADPTDITFRGRAYNKPMWVAQNFDGEHDRNEPLAEEAIASAVNNGALSVWCADCHNLNIGGWEHLANEELGFKAHTEKTHPAPYTGSHSGPAQCYSCHRDDLPRINGYAVGTKAAVGTADSCSQCHYGTGAYYENRIAGPSNTEYVASDFPHSGENGDYKMLGSYSITPIASYGGRADGIAVINENVTVSDTNLDAVCIRCHGGVGTYH